ncbi:hypothetical protein DFQ28_003224 [Apophysomyces sp. BC1034]|nr:hypothetical protein DFQ30_000075 [Apophysomyces sp. BC1015]KAG0183454.1 hypothetical protein DFQ29_004398 [Apophysomyces sp. BC1021]KAG0193820.1 hypothetical protein DFQ28_003224 [Apophysomyces sp. BC1034]
MKRLRRFTILLVVLIALCILSAIIIPFPSYAVTQEENQQPQSSDQGEKFLSYFPHGDYVQQHDQLRNAIRLALETNRTIIAPRLRMGSSYDWAPFSLLAKHYEAQDKTILRRLCQFDSSDWRTELEPCSTLNDWTEINWSSLYDLELLRKRFKVQIVEREGYGWGTHESWLGGVQPSDVVVVDATSFLSNGTKWEHEEVGDQWRMWNWMRWFEESDEEASLKLTEPLTTNVVRGDILRAIDAKIIQFGALSSGLRYPITPSKPMAALSRAMTRWAFVSPNQFKPAANTANNIINTLGGPSGYSSLHINVAQLVANTQEDGMSLDQFNADMQKEMMDSVVLEVFGDIPINQAVSAAMPLKPSPLLDFLHNGTVVGDRRQLLEACIDYRRNIEQRYPIYYLVTDSPPETHPDLFKPLLEFFPCTFTMSDMIVWQVVNRTWTENQAGSDQVDYDQLFLPIVEVLIAGKDQQHNNESDTNSESSQQVEDPSNSETSTRRRRRIKKSVDKQCSLNQKSDVLFYRLQEENARLPPQDSINLILAQIDRQNALLEKDPKSICIRSNELRAHFSTVQRLVTDNLVQEDDIEWQFWEAVIQDFDRVALKMPHLLSVRLRAGIPDHVRGLIWQAMCKSASLHLETVYGQLCHERSPHERIIQRDLTRTFPRIDMFKQENGAGQVAMRRILEAYSLYDADVGYCQGLAFLVGPLLMNMPETQAFCVFVRLMETYEMRTMFTLNMEGLQLRLYQFSYLLSELLPELARHMEIHTVHAAMYASQWFLTLFAYAFPIGLVIRIYDIAFAEGAAETIMRVAIAMLKRSQADILAKEEFEDLLDFVTSQKLCEPYTDDFSDVIRDAMALSGIITREKMESLSKAYASEGQQHQQQEQIEKALAGRFGFWRKAKKMNIKRSVSSNNIKKRWSSISSRESKKCDEPRPSFSSLRGAPPVDSAIQLEQIRRGYQRATEVITELKMDKQDLETERDALKLTIMELERRYYSVKTPHKPLTRSHTVYDTRTLSKSSDLEDSESINSSKSAGDDLFSEATMQTMTTTSLDGDDDDRDSDEAVRAELVRVKVENFEYQQQCEKLTQDLEDVQTRLEMTSDGQMALVDRLVVMKSDMDELMKQKKRKDLEWLQVVQENAKLKNELLNATPRPGRRRSLDDHMLKQGACQRVRELEQMLAEAKIRLAQCETLPPLPSSKPMEKLSGYQTASTDEGLPRSSSLYGRMWHAISPRYSGLVTNTSTNKRSSLA